MTLLSVLGAPGIDPHMSTKQYLINHAVQTIYKVCVFHWKNVYLLHSRVIRVNMLLRTANTLEYINYSASNGACCLPRTGSSLP